MYAESGNRISFRRPLWLFFLLITITQISLAETLPLKSYTTADGLASNMINKIVRDSRGYLWFCTNEGLSRFDGYGFTNYGTDQGLPHRNVNDILETRSGEYWVATSAGLCKFDPKGLPDARVFYAQSPPTDGPRSPMFTVFVPDEKEKSGRAMTTLLQGHDGTIWCGTEKGLFRLAQTGGEVALQPVDLQLTKEYSQQSVVNALLEDSHGTLWVGAVSGLYRRWPDGSVAHYGVQEGLPFVIIHDLLEDHDGYLWVGTPHEGLFRLSIEAGHTNPSIVKSYLSEDGINTNWIFDLYESSRGTLWVGTNRGLCEFSLDGNTQGKLLHVYSKRNGFSYQEIASLGEDRDGNLWLGTNNTGAMRLARNGFITFGEQDGIKHVSSLFESKTGEIYAYGNVLGNQKASIFDGAKLDMINPGSIEYWKRLGRFNGESFDWLVPNAMKHLYLGWSDKPVVIQSRQTGEWWFGTGSQGVFLFPKVSSFEALKDARPMLVLTVVEGLASPDVFSIYEDSRGDVWIATVSPVTNGLARWDSATRTLHDMAQTDGLPSLKDTLPTSFAEDRAGNLWVGLNQGGMARYASGRFTVLTTADGLAPGGINCLYIDSMGRLWVATSRGGVSRIDDPTAARPTFINYSSAQGLTSSIASAITEDLFGRIYIGTWRGLDRLDPATGLITHFTTNDGLAPGKIMGAMRDRSGRLWFGTPQGLSYFTPEPEQPSSPPPILISGLRVAGVRHLISSMGETEIVLPDLASDQRQLQIDFIGLGFASGESLRYQFKLEGADVDWSAPTDVRSVNYANLAPGSYKFFVRAMTSDGSVSSVPALITFTILRPVWQRWWFIGLAALVFGLTTYALYRYRVARVLEVASMRTRIATDLHDDIGANLTRIAILSEVAKQQFGNGDAEKAGTLSSIARISRESVASMSDIVWAVNPKRDSLRDMIRRMRQHAEEIFTLRDIALVFNAPDEDVSLKLGVNVRRDLLLIFKEAVNNAARHSACTKVEIDLLAESQTLSLRVTDNGVGFDSESESEGQGLMSMQRRAQALGGKLEVTSKPGQGTTVKLEIAAAGSRPSHTPTSIRR